MKMRFCDFSFFLSILEISLLAVSYTFTKIPFVQNLVIVLSLGLKKKKQLRRFQLKGFC